MKPSLHARSRREGSFLRSRAYEVVWPLLDAGGAQRHGAPAGGWARAPKLGYLACMSQPLRMVAAASLSLLACGQRPPSPGAESSVATADSSVAAPSTSTPTPAAAGERLYVDAELVDCEGGAGPMKCMRTRASETEEWTLFYSSIEGFTHEAGHHYELRVEKRSDANPPADGSSIRYRLLEIVKKQKAASP